MPRNVFFPMKKYSYSILRASCKPLLFWKELSQYVIYFQWNPVMIHYQTSGFYWLAVTIALRDSLHFPQSRTVMTVGHFLVQSLCPASKIRAKRWGWLRQMWQNIYTHTHPNKDACMVSLQNQSTLHEGLVYQWVILWETQLDFAVFSGQLTLGLS